MQCDDPDACPIADARKRHSFQYTDNTHTDFAQALKRTASEMSFRRVCMQVNVQCSTFKRLAKERLFNETHMTAVMRRHACYTAFGLCNHLPAPM